MAINYTTYYSIPVLRTYAEAKQHHDNVVPIRGDEHKTRPCGRRDQKWFSIWEYNNAIHVGYGRGELSSRRPLVTYHPGGQITVPRYAAYTSASDNERMGRVLGTSFKTGGYRMWVKCAWFDNGIKRVGYQQIKSNGGKYYSGNATPPPTALSHFVRDTDGDLVYLNHTYPITHKVNRAAIKEFKRPYQPFLDYVDRMRKLQGGSLGFSVETRIELFGSYSSTWDGGRLHPNSPMHLKYGDDIEGNWATVKGWMLDESGAEWLRAAATLAYFSSPSSPTSIFDDHIFRHNTDVAFIEEVRKEGKVVRDRYANYFRFRPFA